MGVVDVGPLGEGLLRKPLRLSVLLNNCTECERDVSVGHRVSKMAGAASEGH